MENREKTDRERKKSSLVTESLQTKRVSKVTKGGRRFGFTSLVLVKDQEKKTLAFAHSKGKEVSIAFRKSLRRAQRNLSELYSCTRTIPRDISISYKSTTLLLKPAPQGNGIKAGSVLNKLFKFLEIRDVSAKIIGSRNKLNVIRAAFLALTKLKQRND